MVSASEAQACSDIGHLVFVLRAGDCDGEKREWEVRCGKVESLGGGHDRVRSPGYISFFWLFLFFLA
jgi:hypothetical protein